MQTNQARDLIIEIAEHSLYSSLEKSDKDFINEKVTGARFAKKHNVNLELGDDQAAKVLSIHAQLH